MDGKPNGISRKNWWRWWHLLRRLDFFLGPHGSGIYLVFETCTFSLFLRIVGLCRIHFFWVLQDTARLSVVSLTMLLLFCFSPDFQDIAWNVSGTSDWSTNRREPGWNPPLEPSCCELYHIVFPNLFETPSHGGDSYGDAENWSRGVVGERLKRRAAPLFFGGKKRSNFASPVNPGETTKSWTTHGRLPGAFDR